MTEQEAIERIFGAIEETDRDFACAGGAGNYAAAKAAWNEMKAIAREDLGNLVDVKILDAEMILFPSVTKTLDVTWMSNAPITKTTPE